jgi:hypothetical protein
MTDDCTDVSCQIDLSVDECALPGAGCLPEQNLDDATLERIELAEPIGQLQMRENGAGVLVLLVLVAAALRLRRNRRLPVALLAALIGCMVGGRVDWDPALADGPPAAAVGQYADVVLAQGGEEAAAQFSLARQPSIVAGGGRAIYRAHDPSCGDRLSAHGELVGWAATQPIAGTTALTELVAPGGCGAIYETDPEAAQLYLDDGYTRGDVVGYVWPPGWGEAPVDAAAIAAESVTPCALGGNPALFLFYTGIDYDSNFSLLKGCPGEVVLGEKHMDRPYGEFKSASAHAAGGRTALIFGGNGSVFASMLERSNGVERTAAFIRQRLAAGYDYVVVDEVTMDPMWSDGASVNRRFRLLLTRIPPRSLIAYVSLDLTSYPGGGQAMRDRRLLLRALKLRGRALALEDYLHTGAVMGGAAPSFFRTAADRLAAAVHGLRGAAGISARAITTLGLSMHTRYPQYNYLDEPAHDLASVARQVNAIRFGSSRLRAEHGIGFYFIGRGDITPPSHYSVGELVARIHQSMLRFR